MTFNLGWRPRWLKIRSRIAKVKWLSALHPWHRAYRRDRRWGRRFDRRHGVDTVEHVEVSHMALPAALPWHGSPYVPTPMSLLQSIFKRLRLVHRDFIFVDIGAGKGRVLLLASHYPFKKIIGIEVEPNICQIARDNLARYQSRKQKCLNLEVICADATTVSLPEENLVVFLYNPFDAEVMKQVVYNLERAYTRSSYALYVVYVNPVHIALLEAPGFIGLLELNQSHWIDYAIYTNRSVT